MSRARRRDVKNYKSQPICRKQAHEASLCILHHLGLELGLETGDADRGLLWENGTGERCRDDEGKTSDSEGCRQIDPGHPGNQPLGLESGHDQGSEPHRGHRHENPRRDNLRVMGQGVIDWLMEGLSDGLVALWCQY
jgi:hypothetical protein